MKFYLVVWLATSYQCPLGLGSLPDGAKEMFCRKQMELKHSYSSYLRDALGQIHELDSKAVASLFEIDRGRIKTVRLDWTPVVR